MPLIVLLAIPWFYHRCAGPEDVKIAGQCHFAGKSLEYAGCGYSAVMGGLHRLSREATISDEILQRVAEVYRRIRNTARFLLSNLFDFNPEQDVLPFAELLALDRWAIDRVRRLQLEIKQAYDNFQFHQVSQKLQQFCAV